MLKLKPLIIGIVLEAGTFFGLMCMIAFAAKSFGNVTSDSYVLAIEVVSSLAVLLGAFVASRVAWEKGAIYGGLIALAWVAFRVLYSFIVSGTFDSISMLIKSLIILGLGLTGGMIGISKRRRKMI